MSASHDGEENDRREHAENLILAESLERLARRIRDYSNAHRAGRKPPANSVTNIRNGAVSVLRMLVESWI